MFLFIEFLYLLVYLNKLKFYNKLFVLEFNYSDFISCQPFQFFIFYIFLVLNINFKILFFIDFYLLILFV
jgi:hypothetical protein